MTIPTNLKYATSHEWVKTEADGTLTVGITHHAQDALGDLVYIDDGKGIHSIANASKKPAVSLHLYAGPVSRCRIYNEKVGLFEWVELSYFTDPLSLAT